MIREKLKNIIDGYKNIISEDKVLKPLFEQRMDICNNCPNNKLGICTLCGCVLIAKTRSPMEDCPAHYWKPVFYVDDGFEYVLKSELPLEFQSYFEEEEIELNKWLGFLAMNHLENVNEEM